MHTARPHGHTLLRERDGDGTKKFTAAHTCSHAEMITDRVCLGVANGVLSSDSIEDVDSASNAGSMLPSMLTFGLSNACRMLGTKP